MRFLNLISNLAYLYAGWGNWLTLSCAIILCAGSSIMHYYEEYTDRRPTWAVLADWIGMYAFSLSVLATITSWHVMLLLIPIALLRNEMRDYKLIGVIVLLTISIDVNLLALLIFAVAAGLRFAFENTSWQDYSHSAWHVLTARAYKMIINSCQL